MEFFFWSETLWEWSSVEEEVLDLDDLGDSIVRSGLLICQIVAVIMLDLIYFIWFYVWIYHFWENPDPISRVFGFFFKNWLKGRVTPKR